MSHRIEPLTSRHQCQSFACGNEWLDKYLRKHAPANQASGYARTYVAVDSDGGRVDGFFSISMGCVLFAHLPPALQRNVAKYPMPVCHLGCLAVAADRQGKRLGELLLMDACVKMVAAADIIGARAIDVKAIDDQAKRWYERYGFVPFTDSPLHLYLPLTTVRDMLQSAGIIG